MISIRWRLTLLLCLAIGTLFIATGIGVFVAMKELLQSQFDETLTAKARALITASEIDSGDFEIDLTVQDFAGFGKEGNDYFEIRRMSGKRFMRSPSLISDQKDIGNFADIKKPTDDEPRIREGKFANGKAAHFYVQRFYPKDDKKKLHQDLYLIVASPTGSMDLQFALLTTVLAIAGTAALFLMVPIIRLGLGRGLKPLNQLAADVGRIQPEKLDQRLEVKRLPAELIPVAERLNEWLGRLEASFDRERRFSSHAAHELRTPLAELKSMAELGAMWPEEATSERCAEMVTVANELEALLEKLSLLARADAGRQPVQREPIDLEATLATAVSRVEARATQRRLRVDTRVSPGSFTSDPILWSTILQNLLGNAVSHAPEGSDIVVEASPRNLAVSNPAPGLSEEDLDRLFERFWRKDESRSGYGHSGLGLSIVKACVTLLGGECRASLTADRRFRVEVTFPS
ncbi:ATP-binding protein [Luteolibacter flavescens]|uniref:histidine kinase n=1 Tax=Luteolibacter flavescens TaxID=1859460 RepID=A0ABT3FNQ2_9BACT|nr:ATP-binding protein [Luteolibacter flavescens]MCW1885097.1 ATP-binding protein [Luteolibacter flavescens]